MTKTNPATLELLLKKRLSQRYQLLFEELPLNQEVTRLQAYVHIKYDVNLIYTIVLK